MESTERPIKIPIKQCDIVPFVCKDIETPVWERVNISEKASWKNTAKNHQKKTTCHICLQLIGTVKISFQKKKKKKERKKCSFWVDHQNDHPLKLKRQIKAVKSKMLIVKFLS